MCHEGENLPAENASDATLQMLSTGNLSAKLDKAEHRRIQKRLYMRRKRAEAAGKIANTEALKIRPGRPAKDLKPPKPRPKKYKPRKTRSFGRKRLSQDVSEKSDDDSDLGVDEDARSSAPPRRSPSHQEEFDNGGEESTNGRHTRGGVTRPYKLKKWFHENGITAQIVAQMDLDIFNLTEVGKMLRYDRTTLSFLKHSYYTRLNNSLNVPSRKRDAISISIECIQLLRELIKEFSSYVIQQAIIMKEQEIRLKADLKVWKYDRQEVLFSLDFLFLFL